MALVRSSAVYLWNADIPERVTQVIRPPGSGVVAPAVSTKSFRPGGIAGPEPAAPSFRAVQIAPHGDRIYLLEQSQGQANPLHVWDLARPSDAPTRQAHESRWQAQHTEGAIGLALRGDGNLLAVGDRTGGVSLFDTRTRALLGKIPSPGGSDSENFWLLAMAFSPDGRSLAVGSTSGAIVLWSVTQPEHPVPGLRLPGHRGFITHLTFDAQGRRLACAGGPDPSVEIWDLHVIDRELTRLGLSD
jgi:WD40 repeat protein